MHEASSSSILDIRNYSAINYLLKYAKPSVYSDISVLSFVATDSSDFGIPSLMVFKPLHFAQRQCRVSVELKNV